MSLEQLSHIGEIVASFAVIASLIYLAREVSQNTAMMRVHASQAWTELNFELAGPVAVEREMAECWSKGLSEFESLDDVDKQRLIMYEWRAIEAWHHLFEMHERGILPESQWRKLSWIIKNVGQRQAVQASWAQFRNAYDDNFQGFMTEHLP